ncbi:MAG: class I tRNA ligase family protein, partial [Terriglobales bacterium]
RRITQDFAGRWHFNTSIAALMELVNALQASTGSVSEAARVETVRLLLLMLQPFAPFLTQELWQRLGEEGAVARAAWPEYDAGLAKEEAAEIIVQVNGKLRARLTLPVTADAAEMEGAARAHERIAPLLDGKAPRQVITVPGRLVNFVL